MSLSEKEKELLIQAIMSEPRLKIIQNLKEPKHISKLSVATELDRSTVAYHLNLLKKVGVVRNEYRPILNPEPGWVGNYYLINDEKLREAIELVREKISSAVES